MFIVKRFILPAIFVVLVITLVSAGPNFKYKQVRGRGKVRVVQYADSSWQLLINNKPYFIKGLVYEPVKVGERLTSSNMWMNYDFNNNGVLDTAYESWVDKNRNNKQDEDEVLVGDFFLLKDMGCNTIRIYHPSNIKKEVLRDLYSQFGIRVIMGNFFGAYTWGSGASWDKGTDYADPGQRSNMLADVKKMVLEFKDEPYVLFWMLGNENDMPGWSENSTLNNTNARNIPDVYTKFVNEAARMIHELDSNHPVAVSNGGTFLMKYYARYSPEVDIVGMNAYQGFYGFGTLWNAIKMDFDRPVVITEYGVDCYNQEDDTVDEEFQALYYRNNWRDMIKNSFGHSGVGNSIGGFAYTWLDSWWFCGSPFEHDGSKGAWRGPSKDSWMNDEWMAISSQGDGQHSPFLRQLRKVYYMFQKEWKENL